MEVNARIWRILLILFGILFAYLLVTTAWVSDDAFITFRTVDHWIHGEGLQYNLQERVQTFTHPLWFFCLSFLSYFSGEIYYTILFFSITLSLFVVLVLVFKIAKGRAGAILGITLLCFSKAFIEYSTSGLENSLSHLLLVLFFFLWMQESIPILPFFAIAGLLFLNRLDLGILILIPLIAYLIQNRDWKFWLQAGLCFLPLLSWEIFSVVYYGFPFPNTAYAKLFCTGLSRIEVMERGFFYLLNCLWVDPVTFITIGLGISFVFWDRDRKSILMALGILAYLGYVVWIGGDFMAGRYFSAPFLVAVLLISCREWQFASNLWLMLWLGILLLGFVSPDPPIFSGPSYATGNCPLVYAHKISNERAFFYQQTGLRAMQRKSFPFQDEVSSVSKPVAVKVVSKLGMAGFTAPRNTHVIDFFALADPLLARFPSLDSSDSPLLPMGHNPRFLPKGYILSLQTDENHLTDSNLAKYYDQLKLITRGPIWTWARFKAIWKMNTGQFDSLINYAFFRNPPQISVKWSEIPQKANPDVPWYAPQNVLFSANGLTIDLETIQHFSTIDIGLYRGGTYKLVFINGKNELGEQRIELSFGDDMRIRTIQVQVPDAVWTQGYTTLLLKSVEILHWQSLGYIHLE